MATDAKTRRTHDLHNARLFAERRNKEVRFCPDWGKWLYWDGKRWAVDDCLRVFHYCQLLCASLCEAAPEEEKDFPGHLRRLGSCEGKKAALMEASALPCLQVAASDLDRDAHLLNCQNGTLDLRTGELRPHSPSDLLTKITACGFDETAVGSLWPALIDGITGQDIDLIRYLRVATGYSAIGDNPEQVMFICQGEGSDGKSTFAEIVKAALGDYASTAPPNLLVCSSLDQHPTGVADLAGRRFVTASEADEGRRLAIELVKQITGGDALKARRMREDFWEFRPILSLWFLVNHPPSIIGGDYASERRIRIIPFKQRFTDNPLPGERKRDKTIKARIIDAELPAVLMWLVTGSVDYYAKGLPECQAVAEATAEYIEDQDTVGQMFGELFGYTADFPGLTTTELYSAYTSACREQGIRFPMGIKKFAQELSKRGYEQVKGDRRLWKGLSIKSRAEVF